jgi:RNA polymerase sigma factor (sigma-70 family)
MSLAHLGKAVTLFHDHPQLLGPFRDGEPAALEAVYHHYAGAVKAYLRGLARVCTATELAQASVLADLSQDVFVRAFTPRARRAYDAVRAYSPYLYTIARHGYIDALRRRRAEVALRWDARLDHELSAANMPEGHDPRVISVLQTYLSELPPVLKVVYEQRFIHGLSQAAASDTLGMSRRTLRTREQRLQTGLRKTLQLAGLLTSCMT